MSPKKISRIRWTARQKVVLTFLVFVTFAPMASAQSGTERQKAQVRAAYKELIDAENAHNLKAVAPLVEDSPDALFVAKAPLGWQGYWGKRQIIQHLRDLYDRPFRIDPNYDEEKEVFPAEGVAETYVPVKITAVYGHFSEPSPFIMVVLWVKHGGAWRMISDIPIPIPPSAAAPSPSR